MSMWSLRWHFTNKFVTGAPYSIKGYSYSLSHSRTLLWRVRRLKQCRLAVCSHIWWNIFVGGRFFTLWTFLMPYSLTCKYVTCDLYDAGFCELNFSLAVYQYCITEQHRWCCHWQCWWCEESRHCLLTLIMMVMISWLGGWSDRWCLLRKMSSSILQSLLLPWTTCMALASSTATLSQKSNPFTCFQWSACQIRWYSAVLTHLLAVKQKLKVRSIYNFWNSWKSWKYLEIWNCSWKYWKSTGI